jgi:hypothetical protein
MRFLLPDHLGNDKHSMMFHTSGFAIAAGVVAVGAAAGSAAISMSAADRAKKAQGAAAAQFKKQQRKAVKGFEKGQQQVQGMIGEVQAPQYNLGSMLGDAGQISNYYQQQLEQFQPGAAQQRQQAQGQIGQAMDVISNYLRGEVPQDVREQIMRNVAESAGAGFNPATAGQAGGFQAAQGQFARNLGLTSLDIQGRGLAAMPAVQNTAMNWQNLARAFRAEPLDVGRLQLGYQTAGAEVGLQKAKMTSDMFSNIYNAQSGLATQIYGANKENAAASYAAQQAVGQGVSDIGQATSGALMGMSGAAGQLGTSTTPNAGGFYGGEIGAANAYKVAPSQLSYQKPSGGFMGIGGTSGGYYYTPSGTYGRS